MQRDATDLIELLLAGIAAGTPKRDRSVGYQPPARDSFVTMNHTPTFQKQSARTTNGAGQPAHPEKLFDR